MYVNGGEFKTYNDFSLSSSSSSDHSFLQMVREDDYVYIGRNFFTNAYDSHNGYLTNGLLEIKGNFQQVSTAYYGNRSNFYATGNHKTLFSGNSEQTISFAHPSTCKFNRIETTNPLVTCSTNIGASVIEGVNTEFNNLLLCQDTKVLNDFTAHNFSLNGGEFNLNGHNLNVTENMNINVGVLNVNKGIVNVLNNLSMSSENLSQSGYLKMTNAEDYVFVGNDFFTNSYVGHSGYLTNGLLEIKGNFRQISTAHYGNRSNFFASNEHKTLLSGDNVQTVTFNNAPASKFNVLILTKDKNTGYVFSPDNNWNILTNATEDTEAPSVPTNLTLVNKTSNTVRLRWTAPEETDVLGYKVYRNGAYIGTTYTASYVDRNVPSTGEYTYQVLAFDVSKNESDKSAGLNVNVEEDGNSPVINSITPVQNSVLKEDPTFRVSLCDDELLSSVELYYGNSATDDWTLIENKPLTQQNALAVFSWDTDEVSDGNYDFRVMAYDNSNNVTTQVYRGYNLQTQPPADAVLSGTAGELSVNLSWTNADNNIAYYKIYRSAEENGSYQYIKKVETTSYTDNKLSSENTYYYKVDSVNVYGNSSTSNIVSATPIFVDREAPSVEAVFDVSGIVNEPIAFVGKYATDNVAIASYL